MFVNISGNILFHVKHFATGIRDKHNGDGLGRGWGFQH